jgi:uncharacterized membrane protein YfcA
MLEISLILTIGGMMAGMLGGFLGIGGGILIMPILRFGVGLDPVFAAGTCIVAVFFTTLGGSLKHFRLGHIDIYSILPVIIAGLVSSLIFSLLFVCVTERYLWLDTATGVVFAWVALRMLWEGITDHRHKNHQRDPETGIQGSMLCKVSIGSVAGIFPGLLGIGTGAVLVPAFSFALNAPIKIAIGSSLACFSLNALVSATIKFSQGFVHIPFVIPLCLGALIGSRLGATLNGQFSSPLLKNVFGAVFVYVACKYLMVIGKI